MKVVVNLDTSKIKHSYAIFRENIWKTNTMENPIIMEKITETPEMEAGETKVFFDNNMEIHTDVSSIIEESNISTIGC